jgi:hypothetical protein
MSGRKGALAPCGDVLTDKQLKAAEYFLRSTTITQGKLDTKETVEIDIATIVRLLAWYGAVRYEEADSNLGSLYEPHTLIAGVQ